MYLQILHPISLTFLKETGQILTKKILFLITSLKKTSKYKLKFKTNPWITPGLQKSIAVENKLLKKLFTSKNLIRNYIVTLSTKNTGICYPLF